MIIKIQKGSLNLKNVAGQNKETYKILRNIDDEEPWYEVLYHLRVLGQELNGKLLAEQQIKRNDEELMKP